jgi:hypothetical protein
VKRGGGVHLDGKNSDLFADAGIVQQTHDTDPAILRDSTASGNDPRYWLEAPQDLEGIKWPRVGI